MGKHPNYLVLIVGILSPVMAVLLSALVNGILMHFSADPEKDWRFRLFISTLVMIVPFAVTLSFAERERRRTGLLLSGKIGVAIAFLSLGLILKPVNDGITRSKQERNSMMHGVSAPLFNTSDIFGTTHRLADYEGKVVLVNIWATWCAPCRAEMPKLDQLYRKRESQGFIVFGVSDEEIATQRKYLQQVSVSYPLLTLNGTVPNLYKDIARYPANFLIDRQGKLQPVPDPGKPFEKLATAVDALLSEKPN